LLPAKASKHLLLHREEGKEEEKEEDKEEKEEEIDKEELILKFMIQLFMQILTSQIQNIKLLSKNKDLLINPVMEKTQLKTLTTTVKEIEDNKLVMRISSN